MISIIIIVKNDREIEATINSLKKVRKPEKKEIIVVDSSEGFLDDIKKKFPKVRWIYFHNKTNKKITIPEQRNFGVKKSKGDIIIFVDSGCIVNKEWLYNLSNPILNNSEEITCGPILPITRNSLHDYSWSSIKSRYRKEAGTANLAIKKKVFDKVGYFDESFDYGSDIEFSWRVIDAGYKIRYIKNAIMYHNWGDINQEIKRGFRYGIAKVKLYKKNPSKLKKLFYYNDDLYSIYATLFFFYIISLIPISIIFPYYLLFLLIPLIKNIKVNPLKKMIFDFFWGLGILKELLFP